MRFSDEREFLEVEFRLFLADVFKDSDASHDALHIKRVCANAEKMCPAERANSDIVMPAAWLHDCVHIPKTSPDRKRASTIAAEKASDFLRKIGYETDLISEIEHCIRAHSFSAGIAPRTLEAKVVQDADRLDALGAIGIARCFLTGAVFKNPLYAEIDPFCDTRAPEETRFVLDHFFQKLLTLEETMQTQSGKKEAIKRTIFMREFLAELEAEIVF